MPPARNRTRCCSRFDCCISYSVTDSHPLCYRHRTCDATREGAPIHLTNRHHSCAFCSGWTKLQWTEFQDHLKRRTRDARSRADIRHPTPVKLSLPLPSAMGKKEKKKEGRKDGRQRSPPQEAQPLPRLRRREHDVSSSAESSHRGDSHRSRSRSHDRDSAESRTARDARDRRERRDVKESHVKPSRGKEARGSDGNKGIALMPTDVRDVERRHSQHQSRSRSPHPTTSGRGHHRDVSPLMPSAKMPSSKKAKKTSDPRSTETSRGQQPTSDLKASEVSKQRRTTTDDVG